MDPELMGRTLDQALKVNEAFRIFREVSGISWRLWDKINLAFAFYVSVFCNKSDLIGAFQKSDRSISCYF